MPNDAQNVVCVIDIIVGIVPIIIVFDSVAFLYTKRHDYVLKILLCLVNQVRESSVRSRTPRVRLVTRLVTRI